MTYYIWKSNHNFGGLTNDQLYTIVETISRDLGRVPGLKTIRKKYPEFPKSFSSFRYSGSYVNLAKLVSSKTNIPYLPYFRSEYQRQCARDTLNRSRKTKQ